MCVHYSLPLSLSASLLSLSPSFLQAKNVYTTLKLNNVPSELPSFLLTQTVEIVETQIVFCKKVGTHISSALKVDFYLEYETTKFDLDQL